MFNLQKHYNKLPEVTKGFIDTIPFLYVVLFVAFALNLSVGQLLGLIIPYLVLTFFLEKWKARYIMDRIDSAFGSGYDLGMENKKNDE